MNILLKALASRPEISIFLRKIVEINFRNQKKIIRQNFEANPSDRVLDIGCGTGEFSPSFSKSKYVGIDIDQKNITYAKKHYKGDFRVADGTQLPFENGSFDKILIVGVFHHLSTADCKLVFGEMKRVLKKGGQILIMEDTKSDRFLVKFMQSVDQGAYIRNFSEWNSLLSNNFYIQKSGSFNNGACFYSYFLIKDSS
ncbi:MAG: class I SAM-dependent methyltransferase [bacterium]|nr:class I SAM-dependent methyltransferase [bacterium]